VGVRGHRDGKVTDVGEHNASRYGGVEGGDIKKEEEGGDRGPLWGTHRDWWREVGGALED